MKIDEEDIMVHNSMENTLSVSQFLTKFHPYYVLPNRQFQRCNVHVDLDDGLKESSKNDEDNFLVDTMAVITPQDICSAIQYRNECEQYQYHQRLVRIIRKEISDKSSSKMQISSNPLFSNKHLDSILDKSVEKIWTQKQLRIKVGRSSIDEDVSNVIKTVEVWGTKVLSNNVLLLHPSKEKRNIGGSNSIYNIDSHNHLSQCSTLLNMPSEIYFRRISPRGKFYVEKRTQAVADLILHQKDEGLETIGVKYPKNGVATQPFSEALNKTWFSPDKGRDTFMEQKKDVDHVSLAVPSNCHTWKELLRFSLMVSLLPIEAQREVSLSALTHVSVSLLDCCSSVTNTGQSIGLNRNSKKSDNGNTQSMLSEKSTLTQSDLVALWVRAQRSTSAWRHIIHLFQVSEVETFVDVASSKDVQLMDVDEANNTDNNDDEIGKIGGKDGTRISTSVMSSEEIVDSVKDIDQKTVGTEENSVRKKFVAAYVGNHKKMKIRVERESAMLEKLMEWAIMNQVLFTHQYIRTSLSLPTSERGDSKKRCDNGERNESAVSKRRRVESESDKTGNCRSRKNAEEVYLLRWFARRNRELLSILFSSTPIKSSNPKTMENTDILERFPPNFLKRIKSNMKKNRSSDRTFPRIDRRILIGKYEVDGVGTFDQALLSLLKSMKGALPINSSLVLQVQASIDDFLDLHRRFITDKKDESSNSETSPLLEQSKHLDLRADQSIEDQLLSLPRPWFDKCLKCNMDVKEDDGASKVCRNCGIIVHSECEKDKLFPIQSPKEDLDEDKLLILFFKDLIENSGPAPDFVRQSIVWTQKKIKLMRILKEGDPQTWGISLTNSEYCCDSLQKVETLLKPLSMKTLPTLDDVIDSLSSPPMRILQQGLVVSNVKDDYPAEIGGLKRSDVITKIKVQNEDKTWNKYRVAEMTVANRMSMFKLHSEAIELTIERPSKDLNQLSIDWLENLRISKKKIINIHKKLIKERWYCNGCQTKPHGLDSKMNRLVSEAKQCRAVIRRLGMEWCSLPFHSEERAVVSSSEENDVSDDVVNVVDNYTSNSNASIFLDLNVSLKPLKHCQHVSLRRIDAMMVAIIVDHTAQVNESNGSTKIEPMFLQSAFNVPPEMKDGGNRLDWLDNNIEHRPFELLCRGILLIVSKNVILKRTESDNYEVERNELRYRFLDLFVPWCLDCSNSLTIGPPLGALNAVEPWSNKSCCICRVRPIEFDSQNDKEPIVNPTCNVEECRNLHRKILKEHDKVNEGVLKGKDDTDINDIESKMANQTIFKYDFHSSFVGITLLILPGDPILQSISQILCASIEHDDRPFELLVVSYLPHGFLSEEQKQVKTTVREKSSDSLERRDKEGVYHVVPVMSSQQLEKFVLPICEMRKFKKSCWTDLRVTRLPAIIELTPTELLKRLEQTKLIRTCIDERIAAIAQCDTSNDLQIQNKLHKSYLSEKDKKHNSVQPSAGCIDTQSFPSHRKCNNQISSFLNSLTFLQAVDKSSSIFLNNGRTLVSPTSNSSQIEIDMLSLLIDLGFQSAIPMFRMLISDQIQITNKVERFQTCTTNPDFDTDTEDAVDGSFSYLRKKQSTRGDGNIDDACNLHSQYTKQINSKEAINETEKDYFMIKDSDAAKNGSCQICYTDLVCFKTKKEIDAASINNKKNLQNFKYMEKLISKRILKIPQPYRGNSPWKSDIALNEKKSYSTMKTHLIVLFRIPLNSHQKSSDDDSYDESGNEMDDVLDGEGKTGYNNLKENVIDSSDDLRYIGKGWGFELVRWSEDHHTIRVGRVCPRSPSADAGLVPHDIIVSINGQLVTDIANESILAQIILNRSPLQNNLSSDSSKYASVVVINSMDNAVNGPLALEIIRMTCYNTLSPTQQNKAKIAQQNQTKIAQQIQAKDIIQINSLKVNVSHSKDAQNATLNVSPLAHNSRIQKMSVTDAQSKKIHTSNYNTNSSEQIPSFNREISSGSSSTKTYHDVNESDLYRPGFKGSFISRVETSILIEAMLRKLPTLGMRLLSPRYELNMIKRECLNVVRPSFRQYGFASLPKITEVQWKALLQADYNRSKCETGSILFSEGGYSYREPVTILPLDRIFERLIYQNKNRNQQQQQQQRDQSQNKPNSNTSYYQAEPLRVQHPPSFVPNPIDQYPPSSYLDNSQKNVPAHTPTLPNNYDHARSNTIQSDNTYTYSPSALIQNYGKNYDKPLSKPTIYHQNDPTSTTINQQYERSHKSIESFNNNNSENKDMNRENNIIDLVDEPKDIPEKLLLSSQPEQNNDLFSKRIRGGGLAATSSILHKFENTALSLYHPSKWSGIAVHTKCNTCDNQGKVIEVTAIGHVTGSVDSSLHSIAESRIEGTVPVNLFWMSTSGYLNDRIQKNIPVKNLNVIQPRSKKQTIVDELKLHKQRYLDQEKRIRESEESLKLEKINQLNQKLPPEKENHQFVIDKLNNEIFSQRKSSLSNGSLDKLTNIFQQSSIDQFNLHQLIDRLIDKSLFSSLSAKMMPLNMAAELLVKRLQHRSIGSSKIGSLPDSRTVYWFAVDPTALYLSSSCSELKIGLSRSKEQEDYTRQREYCHNVKENMTIFDKHIKTILRPCQYNKYCCVWGCSEVVTSADGSSERRVLAFDSNDQLKNHLLKCHSYDSGNSRIDILDMNRNLIRIPQGERIRWLCADLTSSICARNSCLTKGVEIDTDLQKRKQENPSLSPFSHMVLFNPKKLLHLRPMMRGTPNFSPMKGNRLFDRSLRELLRLLSRIMRLFNVEGNGYFRLNKSIFKDSTYNRSNTDTVNVDDGNEKELFCTIRESLNNAKQDKSSKSLNVFTPQGKSCNFQQLSKDDLPRNIRAGYNCQLCSMKGDHVVRSNANNLEECIGIGCALLTDVCGLENASKDPIQRNLSLAYQALVPTSNEIDSVKVLLLRVATNVPKSLYLSSTKRKSAVDRLTHYKIFDTKFLSRWIQFVEQSINGQMLSQALSVLISSINKQNMPKWWVSESSGWSNSFVCMNMPTLSKISLHIYVLDAAIADYAMSNKLVKLITDESSDEMKVQTNRNDADTQTGDAATNTSNNDITLVKLPKTLLDMEIRKRAKVVFQWATELELPKFDGETSDVCCRCDEGGTLLCCEYCANVQHARCLVPPQTTKKVDFDWICDDCICDIHLLREDS